MNEALRTWNTGPSRVAPTWQLRPWPNDPTAMLLVFVDHTSIPAGVDLEEAVARARSEGIRTLRTSALLPRAAEVAREHGFVPIDTLHLLRLPFDEATRERIEVLARASGHDTRPLRAWHHGHAATVDQDAFGATWGNDAASVADIRVATPHHRARLVRDGRQMAGFAISGWGGHTGYVQRVAVRRDHRRRGIARSLVVDALAWMGGLPVTAAYVNTGLDNAAALALYEDLGFERLDERLVIAARDISA
ncbi:MAG TPA: GNAT family N-acetyltransferase [Ilumatobacteraceae bacterium]|nr:GNAT family N-acetyltransferase [Ilumatobacteraceae bacterium]